MHGLNNLDIKNNQVFKNLSLPNFNLPKTDIHIHLNTVGGYCFDGLALSEQLKIGMYLYFLKVSLLRWVLLYYVQYLLNSDML